ncbi:MAG: T9SS type A sorting domain-containing protein [Flavobacterium sp.]|nr:T9SS type A sorting domain-containing protein [Flavobacterium sp.]
MKITLPILLLFTLSFQAQTQISALNGSLANMPFPIDGVDFRIYQQFVPETVFDQSSAGFDQTWDISGFTFIADQTKEYYNTVPATIELPEFPGATMRTTGSITTINGATIDSKSYASGSGLLGYEDSTFLLKYATDNADFGSFPQMYGDLHYDTVAGNYIYGAYSGTFEGTLITEVDAYGSMTTTEETGEVTRLKTIETLQISYPGFGVIGTLVQTTYRYYRENDWWPLVKSTNSVLDVDLLNVHTNTTNIEKANWYFQLNVINPNLNQKLAIVPNPVGDTTEILTSGQTIIAVVITDNSGKEVYTKKGTAHLDLSALPTGTYLARIQTSEGTSVKKIIKK